MGVKDTKARKKAAFKELCRLSSEESKAQYKRLRNKTRKIVARAMRMEGEQKLNDLYQNCNRVFCFLRMKKEGKNESAKEEETNDWILLKTGQKLATNTWKRS